MKIRNISKSNVLVKNGMLADNFFTRFKGLMGKKELKKGEALCIKPCKGIHTFFMRFNIDAVFINKKGKVCKIIKNLRPWKIAPYVKEAEMVIELPKGAVDEFMIEIGDKIVFRNL
ncbi:hypothetical protein BET03_07035 [Thermohalobacter berrensis]|uniref:DUF192 domain-containing protein n=1 Tax=Thermohalobacter berrensis TaxID=99594 RepID=A0A419SUG3_9FIRM|nr:hypothetical protein BET03_07035 [Thermohalobacter berrensis]